jgi:hypothetical protein
VNVKRGRSGFDAGLKVHADGHEHLLSRAAVTFAFDQVDADRGLAGFKEAPASRQPSSLRYPSKQGLSLISAVVLLNAQRSHGGAVQARA